MFNQIWTIKDNQMKIQEKYDIFSLYMCFNNNNREEEK